MDESPHHTDSPTHAGPAHYPHPISPPHQPTSVLHTPLNPISPPSDISDRGPRISSVLPVLVALPPLNHPLFHLTLLPLTNRQPRGSGSRGPNPPLTFFFSTHYPILPWWQPHGSGSRHVIHVGPMLLLPSFSTYSPTFTTRQHLLSGF